jgi:hypothetical protein
MHSRLVLLSYIVLVVMVAFAMTSFSATAACHDAAKKDSNEDYPTYRDRFMDTRPYCV